jgi:hypothetical protein
MKGKVVRVKVFRLAVGLHAVDLLLSSCIKDFEFRTSFIIDLAKTLYFTFSDCMHTVYTRRG